MPALCSMFARGLAAVLLLALILVSPAFAHAQLIGSDPADGAILPVAPATLSLRYNEPVTPLSLSLIAPDGSQSALAAPAAGEAIAIPLPAPLADGTHVLSWRVTSADGHPIGGALVFSIGAATGAAAVPQSDPIVAIALWGAKAALFIALFLGLGGVLFRALAPLPPGAERLLAALCLAGFLLAPVSLGLHGLDALGLPLGQIGVGAARSAALTTSYGATVICLGVAFALALGALRLPRSSESNAIALFAAALGALSLSLSGHASAASPQVLTRPAVFLHMAGLLFWLGALLPLAAHLRRRTAAADHALARFSRFIPLAVGALLASGLALATVQMGPPGPAWFSPYAAILAAKLGLLAVLFALALWNRFGLTEPALAGAEPARRHLRRSILAETVLVVLVLGLAAGWRFTPPPRALAVATSAEPILVHAMNADLMAMVTVTGAPGTADLLLELTDINYAAIEPQSVTVILASPALGVEPIRRDAEETAAGWEAQDLAIPLAGPWTLDLEIRLSRFALSKLTADFEVP